MEELGVGLDLIAHDKSCFMLSCRALSFAHVALSQKENWINYAFCSSLFQVLSNWKNFYFLLGCIFNNCFMYKVQNMPKSKRRSSNDSRFCCIHQLRLKFWWAEGKLTTLVNFEDGSTAFRPNLVKSNLINLWQPMPQGYNLIKWQLTA